MSSLSCVECRTIQRCFLKKIRCKNVLLWYLYFQEIKSYFITEFTYSVFAWPRSTVCCPTSDLYPDFFDKEKSRYGKKRKIWGNIPCLVNYFYCPTVGRSEVCSSRLLADLATNENVCLGFCSCCVAVGTQISWPAEKSARPASSADQTRCWTFKSGLKSCMVVLVLRRVYYMNLLLLVYVNSSPFAVNGINGISPVVQLYSLFTAKIRSVELYP